MTTSIWNHSIRITIPPIILVGVGLAVFWLPYLLLYTSASRSSPLSMFLCLPLGLYLTGTGMVRMNSGMVRLAISFLLNLAGMVAYLLVASKYWIEPKLADMPGASGGAAIVWFDYAVPILLGFLLLNVAWSFLEGFAYLNKKPWQLRLIQLLVPFPIIFVSWIVALYIDFSHHGM